MLWLLPLLLLAAPEPHLVVQRGHADQLISIVYTADGRRLVTLERKRLNVWDLRTRLLMHSIDAADSTDPYLALVRRNDGKLVLVTQKRAGVFDPVTLRFDKQTDGAFDICDVTTSNPSCAGKYSFDTKGLAPWSVSDAELSLGISTNLSNLLKPSTPPQAPGTIDLSIRPPRVYNSARRLHAAQHVIGKNYNELPNAVVVYAEDGKVLSEVPLGDDRGAESIDISPDGTRFAYCHRETVSKERTQHRVSLVRVGELKPFAHAQYDADNELFAGLCKIRFSPDGNTLVMALAEKVRLLDTSDGSLVAELFPRVQRVVSMNTANISQLELLTSGGKSNWDLSTGRLTTQASVTADVLLAISNDRRLALTCKDRRGLHEKSEAYLIDMKTQKPLRTWTFITRCFGGGFDERGTRFWLASGDDYLIYGALDAKGKPTKEQRLTSHGHNAVFQGDNLFVATSKSFVSIDTVTNAKRYAQDLSTFYITGVALTRDGKHAMTAYGGDCESRVIKVFDAKTLLTVESYELLKVTTTGSTCSQGDTYSAANIDVSPSGRYLGFNAYEGKATLFDRTTNQQMRTTCGHTKRVSFTEDERFAIHALEDGSMCAWDLKQNTVAAVLAVVGQDEGIIALPSGHYMASKKALDAVAFEQNGRVFPVAQFDLRLNRPDVVLERLGYAPPNLTKAYKRAWEKRVERSSAKATAFALEFTLPEAEIKNALPPQTSTRGVVLSIGAKAAKAELASLHVFVNDVPLFGRAGKAISGATFLSDVPFELSAGRNRVEVMVRDANGADSLREVLATKLTGVTSARKRFVVAIGVSDYSDDAFDLNYAAKDAADFSGQLHKEAKAFSQTSVKVIADKDATRETIQAAKAFFANATVDDQVVLFAAGHGVLDSQLDYYFATSDLDFSAPQRRGLAYSDLEGLLEDTKARSRLFFLDTCHSGEVDKTGVSLVTATSGPVKNRGLKKVRLSSDGLALQETLGLMREQFASFERGAGARVFSAASGSEFAYESGAWKNGVFTYSILQGLAGKDGDANRDGEVSVSELFRYVAKSVNLLTNGLQTPNARVDGIALDDIMR